MNRTIAWCAVVALVVGVFMQSDLTYRKRRYERELRERVESVDNLVDIGVELRTVVADPNGELLLPGKPRLRIVRTCRAGGIVDTKRGQIVAPSQRRVIWYCSEDQEPIIRHLDSEPLGIQAYGSEGAGKTTILPKWLYFRWLENLGERREFGLVAPTSRRLRAFLKEFRAAFPANWFSYTKYDNLVVLCDQTRLQLVSAHQQSKDEGSPVQSFDWSAAAGDEDQDMVDRHDDIEARGRAAKGGRYKQLRTATPKDSSEFRKHKDKLDRSGHWARRTMLGRNSPFIDPSHWNRLERTLSPREYQRRVLAQDVGVELAVYYGWARARNLVPYPRIATDLTPSLLGEYSSYISPASRFTLLGSHDPGVIWNVSEVLKLLMFGEVPTYTVVGEYVSKQTTQREHAIGFAKYLAKNFGIERRIVDDYGIEHHDPDSSKIAIFCDPHGKGEAQTDYQSVYGAFQSAKLDVFNPAPISGKIKRRPRVEMVNGLLCNQQQVARLVVACDERGEPLAPVLVDAFETLEKRPGDDTPEGIRRKDIADKTHAPASVGYCLWPFEQEALTDHTLELALTAARRLRV